MERKRPIIGFVLAPIPACITFAFGMLAFTLSDISLLPLTVKELLFGTLITFLFASALAYPITLIFGIPSYYFFNKIKLYDMKSYAISGLILGFVAPLSSVMIFGLGFVSSLKFYVYIIGSIFGIITTMTFWYVAIYSPNQPFNSQGSVLLGPRKSRAAN